MRARGLKYGIRIVGDDAEASRPVRARGLKSAKEVEAWRRRPVAPREGAWIEISTGGNMSKSSGVAPREGAWIEILWNAPPFRER